MAAKELSGERLFTDDLHQHSLPSSTIKFAVENLFPRAEIKFALSDCDYHVAAHDLALEMGVGIVLAGAIMSIRIGGGMRRQFFQPLLIIVMQSDLIVVDEHRGGYVHGVDQTKTLLHAALMNEFLDLRCDVDESAPIRGLEPQMLSQRLHKLSRLDFNETRTKLKSLNSNCLKFWSFIRFEGGEPIYRNNGKDGVAVRQ